MPDVGRFFDQVGSYALTWLPLVFFGLIIYLLWRTLQHMPRVKPAKLEASANSSVTWDDVAGLEEAKSELQEVVDFLRYPKRFQRLGARGNVRRASSSGHPSGSVAVLGLSLAHPDVVAS